VRKQIKTRAVFGELYGLLKAKYLLFNELPY